MGIRQGSTSFSEKKEAKRLFDLGLGYCDVEAQELEIPIPHGPA
jgi:hypothetical protein